MIYRYSARRTQGASGHALSESPPERPASAHIGERPICVAGSHGACPLCRKRSTNLPSAKARRRRLSYLVLCTRKSLYSASSVLSLAAPFSTLMLSCAARSTISLRLRDETLWAISAAYLGRRAIT